MHHVAMDHRGAVGAALAAIAVLASTASTGSARAAGVDMEVALDVGFIPERVHGSTASPIPGAMTPGGGSAGVIGDNSLGISGGAIGANAAMMFPDFGPGLPRVFLYGDATVFLGRKNSTQFDLYDPAPSANDTTLTLKRNFALDVALGGIFPFCREPTCLDLRFFFGASFLHQTITTGVDEAAVGGKKEEVSGSKIKPSAMLGALVSIPFGERLRLQLGCIFRSLSSVSATGSSSSGRSYTSTIDGGVETQLTAALAIPFSL